MAETKDFIIVENDNWVEAGNKLKTWWMTTTDKIVNGYTFHPTNYGIDIINREVDYYYAYSFPKNNGTIDFTFAAQELYEILITQDQHEVNYITIGDVFGITRF